MPSDGWIWCTLVDQDTLQKMTGIPSKVHPIEIVEDIKKKRTNNMRSSSAVCHSNGIKCLYIQLSLFVCVVNI